MAKVLEPSDALKKAMNYYQDKSINYSVKHDFAENTQLFDDCLDEPSEKSQRKPKKQ